MPRLLELFSGTGSIGKAFRELGWEITSLDLGPKANPTICVDICEWEPEYEPGYFDFIWASPVCTGYSRVLTRRPRRLEDGDRLVIRTLQLIEQLRPRFWALENPATGLLKTRPFMAGLPWEDVSYCMYGMAYRKLTRIWTNLNWVPSREVCGVNGHKCPTKHRLGYHEAMAQRGTIMRKGKTVANYHSQQQLYMIPPELCRELAAYVNAILVTRPETSL